MSYHRPVSRFYVKRMELCVEETHAPWPHRTRPGRHCHIPIMPPATEYRRTSTPLLPASTRTLAGSGGKAVNLEQREHERHAVAGAAFLGIGRARHVAV